MIEYRLSVRALAETAQVGDLDKREFSFTNRLKNGVDIHRLIQSKYKESDLKEAFLNGKYENDDVKLIVSGRADGILNIDTDPVIEEIKSVQMQVSSIFEPLASHIAQAMIYAHFYCENKMLDTIRVRVHYYAISNGQSRIFEEKHNAEELKSYFYALCEKVAAFVKKRHDRIEIRNQSIDSLKFPFSYRKAQIGIVSSIYKAQNEQKSLFLASPTGSGKTLSCIYASLHSIKGDSAAKIIYLTSKALQRLPAINAISLLEKEGLNLLTVTLTAKEKCCLLDEPDCCPESCQYAEGYFEKADRLILFAIENCHILDAESIKNIAEEYKACPYEISLDLARWADIIICDYNYYFDPFSQLDFLIERKTSNALLIDEAHNLLQRSREMHSARIDRSAFAGMKKHLSKDTDLGRSISKVLRCFNNLKKDVASIKLLEKLCLALQNFTENISTESTNGTQNNEIEKYLTEPFRQAHRFLKIYSETDNSHKLIHEVTISDESIVLFCMDAKNYLAANRKMARSAVYFSATLHPLSFYCEMLGGKTDDYLLSAPQIFKQENFDIIADLSISTEYRKRGGFYGKVAERIISTAGANKGNILIFFPSYEYMSKVYEEYKIRNPIYNSIIQPKGMNELERAEFISKFSEDSQILAFAVNGGLFSEALDLGGGKLSSVIVVGVSIPKVTFEQEAIREYFDNNGRDGFAYAYIYPGVNKVLQAMGRVIRDESDKGFAILIDERFGYGKYRSLLLSVYAQTRYVKSDEEFSKAIGSLHTITRG